MADEVKVNETPQPTETVVETPKAEAPAAPTAVASSPQKPKAPNSKTILIIVVVIALIGGGLYLKDRSDKKNSVKVAENLIESLTGNKVDVDTDKQSFEIKDEETGESVSTQSNQKLPSDFPKSSIPFLDEKSITAVVTSKSDDKKNWSVTTTVKESVEEAAAFFESKLVEPDFTSVNSYGYNDSKSFSATSEKYGVFVTISKTTSDSDTNVTYVVTEE